MQAYCMSFGFRPPYQVLLDAEIIKDAARFKMRLGSLLEGALHAGASGIKPMITQCCIRHLYNAPATTDEEKKQKDGWIEVAKQAERRRCGHHELEEPLSALECLLSVVDPKGSGSNKNRYIVATQEQEVRQRMRQIAGVPLVYINRSVMILEPMAASTEKVRAADEKSKIRAGLKSMRPASSGVKRKRADENEDADMPDRAKAIAAAEVSGTLEARAEPVQKKRKAKGPKGPNPLSMKKAKTEKPKPVARQVEDERSAIRKATKRDPQASEKAVDAEVAAEEGAVENTTEGARKRKRKRKPREGHPVTGESAGVEAVAAAEVVGT